MLGDKAKTLQAELEKIKGRTCCAFCGQEYKRDTVTGNQIREHISSCLDHSLHAAKKELSALQAENKRLRDAIKCVQDLMENSAGVDGLHLNGDIASWEELRTGGQCEGWLMLFDEALEKIEEE